MYTHAELPPFKTNTSGIANPKAGAPVAVCTAPASATIKRPPSWGAGQALAIAAGSKHIAQDSVGDSYPNMEFDTFYTIGEKLEPATDVRAAYLVGFWAGQGEGYDVEVRLAQKTRHAIVLGEIDDSAIGKTFTNHEGSTEITAGSRILQSPDDSSVRWLITEKVYGKKYEAVVLSAPGGV